MISRLEIPYDLPYIIIISHDKKKDKYGWGIVLNGGKTILIEPTKELEKYCEEDETMIFKSGDSETTGKCRFGIGFHVGTYLQQNYIVLPGKVLVPMGVPCEHWPKLIKKLKPDIILTPKGQVQNQVEAYVQSLV